jgi:hypothetical protein
MACAAADAAKIVANARHASDIAGDAWSRSVSADSGVAASAGFADVSVDADAESLDATACAGGRSQPAAPRRRRRNKGRFIIRFVRVVA